MPAFFAPEQRHALGELAHGHSRTKHFKEALGRKATAYEREQERGGSKAADIIRWMQEVAAANPFPPLPGNFI